LDFKGAVGVEAAVEAEAAVENEVNSGGIR
jgi:hypothetical protein